MSKKQKIALGKRIALYLTAGLLSCNLVYANPSGETTANSAVVFDRSVANVLNITGVTNGTVINWNAFSIAAGEKTHFTNTADTASGYAVLNRVVGSNPSSIYGALIADNAGQVFLVNQNGIVIGGGAVINTGQFVASTVNITDTNFINYANGGKLIFAQADNLATVNGGSSGEAKIVSSSGAANAIYGTPGAAAGDIILLGSTVSVAPGVTFTVTNAGLNLLAAQSLTYDPSNTKDGMSYAATPANTVTVGDGTGVKGINLTANDITLAGGAVAIAGPSATAADTNGNDTTKKIRMNAAGSLDIYALNAKTESYTTENSVTTYTSQYSADKNNVVTISGNVKINDVDSNGNSVSGEKVNIIGGAVKLEGIDTDHKVLINNTKYGVSLRAIKTAALTSNNADSAGTTTLTADKDSTVTLNHAKVIAGTETGQTKTREISMQGGAVSLADTRLEADGGQWDGIGLNAFKTFQKTTNNDNTGSTTGFTMETDNTVAIDGSTIVTPDITVTGSAIGITSSALTASDTARLYAGDTLTRTKTSAGRTEALTATAANTLSLTNSSIRMNPFSKLWGLDNATYNDSYATSGLTDNRKDIQLIGGKVALIGYQTFTPVGETVPQTMGVIYDDSKNTDILIGAGNNIQYAYSGHALDASAVTSYSGTAANTVNVDMSSGAAATLNAGALITGQDVTMIGGAVNVTGKDNMMNIQAAETNAGTGNVGVYAVESLSKSDGDEDLSLTATKDNTITLGSTLAPVTITAGRTASIYGGKVSIAGQDSSHLSTITASQDIFVHAAATQGQTISATPENTLQLSFTKLAVNSNGSSEDGIQVFGGKVDVDHAILTTTKGDTLNGDENPTAVNIAAIASAKENWSQNTANSITTNTGTTEITTATGNAVTVSNSTITSPDISLVGNTVTLNNSQLTAWDYMGLSAVETMKSVETEKIDNGTHIYPDHEAIKQAATTANNLTVSGSTLTINSDKATPGETVQTDIQIVGGVVSMTGDTLSTNNTTDVLIAAGNTVEYEHGLHSLVESNVTKYEGASDNKVTLGSASSPTAITATNVTVIGGKVTKDNAALIGSGSVNVVEKAPATPPNNPSTPTSPTQIQDNPSIQPVVQVNQAVSNTVVAPSTGTGTLTSASDGGQGAAGSGSLTGGILSTTVMGGGAAGTGVTGGSLTTGGTGSNVAPGVTLAGETGSAAPQQSPQTQETQSSGQTQQQGVASGNSTQEQKK